MTRNFYLQGDRGTKKHAGVCRRGRMACPLTCQCWCHERFETTVDIVAKDIRKCLRIISSFSEERRAYIIGETFNLDNIEETLRGVLAWITRKDRVTDKQQKAVENILEGLKQWVE